MITLSHYYDSFEERYYILGVKEMRIETERLIIRSIEKGDEKVFAEMAKDGSFDELGFDENCSE